MLGQATDKTGASARGRSRALDGRRMRNARRHLTISGSALGAEGEMLRRQLARFMAAHPEMPRRKAAHARRRRSAASALRPVVERAGRRARHAAARRDRDARVRRRGMDLPLDTFRPAADDSSPPRSSQPMERIALRDAVVRRRRRCSIGEPTWSTQPRRHLRRAVGTRSRAQREQGLPFGFVWRVRATKGWSRSSSNIWTASVAASSTPRAVWPWTPPPASARLRSCGPASIRIGRLRPTFSRGRRSRPALRFRAAGRSPCAIGPTPTRCWPTPQPLRWPDGLPSG